MMEYWKNGRMEWGNKEKKRKERKGKEKAAKTWGYKDLAALCILPSKVISSPFRWPASHR